MTYSNWNLNYLSSLNDTVLQNTLNLNREHSGKGFAKVLCLIAVLSSCGPHWHLSKEFMRRRVIERILISFQVNIFFKDMYVKRTIETKEFPNTSSFLANLGGALSLYLGTSLIALFEILELLVRLLVSGVAYLF